MIRAIIERMIDLPFLLIVQLHSLQVFKGDATLFKYPDPNY